MSNDLVLSNLELDWFFVCEPKYKSIILILSLMPRLILIALHQATSVHCDVTGAVFNSFCESSFINLFF